MDEGITTIALLLVQNPTQNVETEPFNFFVLLVLFLVKQSLNQLIS